MNHSKLIKFEIFSLIFVFAFGTLLHFTYQLSRNNLFVGLFSAVNESTWEHLKLLFFPMLFMSFLGYFVFKKRYYNYLCIKVKSIVLGLIASFAIYKAFAKSLDYGFIWPLHAILISIVFVFIIVFIIMRFAISKVNKQNIIETIRKENV